MPKVMPVDLIRSHIKEWAGKKSILQIADDLGISATSVKNNAALIPVSLEVTETVERRKRINKIITKHHSKKTICEIAEMTHESYGIIKYYGDVLGLEFKAFRRGAGKVHPIRNGKYFNERANTNWLV